MVLCAKREKQMSKGEPMRKQVNNGYIEKDTMNDICFLESSILSKYIY